MTWQHPQLYKTAKHKSGPGQDFPQLLENVKETEFCLKLLYNSTTLLSLLDLTFAAQDFLDFSGASHESPPHIAGKQSLA